MNMNKRANHPISSEQQEEEETRNKQRSIKLIINEILLRHVDRRYVALRKRRIRARDVGKAF